MRGPKPTYEQALALAPATGQPPGRGQDLGNLGLVAYVQGDHAGAKAYLEQALALHRQLGNRLGEATDLGNLGVIARLQGDHEGSKSYLEQSARVYQQMGLPVAPFVQSALDELAKQP